MRRSTRVMLGTVCLVSLLLASLSLDVSADGPVKQTEAIKPPWQRYLQGEDAKKAAEQEKKLAQLQEAGMFQEALKVAKALAELRTRAQGAHHWEVVDARFEVEAIRRVMNASKEDQQNYSRTLTMYREAMVLQAKDRYREAEMLSEQVLTIRLKVLGEEHPYTALSYSKLAVYQDAQAKYKQAEEGFRKALAIRLKVLGQEHPDTATSYMNLAFNLKSTGKYKEAEERENRALAIYCKVLGEEHRNTASCYDNIAYTLYCRGMHVQAEEAYRKALAIRRRVLGEDHPETAKSYNNLSANLDEQGKYVQAEEGYRKALATYLKVLGEEALGPAMSYMNLALNQNNQGKYVQAEEGLRKTLTIYRKVLGEEHPSTALSYHNLAGNLSSQGKYVQAEEGFRKALAIYRKVLGEENRYPAASYGGLAGIQYDQGKYAQAEEGLRKALAIYRKVLGEEHPVTAAHYNSLGASQLDQGKYLQAEENARNALSIYLKVRGEENPGLVRSYNILARNQNAQGRYIEGEQSSRKALAISSKVLGEEHPETIASNNNLAFNQYAQGKYDQAEALWRKTAASFTIARSRVTYTGLERANFATWHSPLPPLAAVLARNGKPDEAWQRFEESLARGTWDDLSARLRRLQAERDKQTQITARIDRLNQRINSINAAKLTDEQSKQRDELLSQLRQAYDELSAFNRELEKKYGPVAGEVFSRNRIQTALAEDTALLAWLDIPGQPKAADPNGEHWAILLRSSGDPIWVRMKGSGDKNAWTDADTQLPRQLRAALQVPDREWQPSATSASGRGSLQRRSQAPHREWRPLAQGLRQQRLDPLAQHLKGVRRLIVLPSTALAGVPIEVIAEGYTVSYAHSGTMYAHLRQPTTIGKGLFVLADPVFDAPVEKEKPQPVPPSGVLLTFVAPGSNALTAGLKRNDVLLRYGDTDLSGPRDFKPQPESNDPDKSVPVVVWREGKTLSRPLFVRPGKLGVAIAQEPAQQALDEQRKWDRKLASRSGDESKWPRLPGTRIEAASLQRLFDKDAPFKLLLDSDASEERLNELAKSGELGKYLYLHLATHGEVNDSFPLRSAVILSRDHLPDDKQRTELLVSGQPIPDGRLEAEEALQRWNLHCDLVTLSACETALGKYERGEGFVGFAQSLILCGTRSVCLSLWRVSDTATALLMERFYQNLLGKRDGLKGPMPKAAALAEAKQWLRNLSREEAVKHAASLSNGVDRGKRPAYPPLEIAPATAPVVADKGDRPFAHPYYWAAFVLVGHAD